MSRQATAVGILLASSASAQVALDSSALLDLPPGVQWAAPAVALDAVQGVAFGGVYYPQGNGDGVGHATGTVGHGGGYGGGTYYPSNLVTSRFDPSGALAWTQRSNFNEIDTCTSVAFDGAGGVFVAGGAYDPSGPTSLSQRLLLHYDAGGTLLWSQLAPAAPASSWSFGYALALCANGDVVVAGSHQSDASLERYDPSGNLIWSWTSTSPHEDYLNSVAVGPGGDIWASGVLHAGTDLADVIVVRLTSAGAPLWVRTLDGADHGADYANALAVDAMGNAWVAASIATAPLSLHLTDAAIARWDATGNLAWVRTYGKQTDSDHATEIALDPFGRAVVAGTLTEPGVSAEFAAWCLDLAGSLSWRGSWRDPLGGYVGLGALAVDASGAAWLCGTRPESTGGSATTNVVVAAFDSTGAPRWTWTHAGPTPGSWEWVDLAVATGSTVRILGGTVAGTGGADGFVLELTRTALEYCVGSGAGTPCPCGNASPAEQNAGCQNSLGVGARIVDRGASSLAADTLGLAGSQMTDGTALYFQGTAAVLGGAGAVFGDGLRCAAGTVVRLGSKANVNGASEYPGAGDPSVSLRGLVTSPGTRTYQLWYRNVAAFCAPESFNLSNGLLVTWTS